MDFRFFWSWKSHGKVMKNQCWKRGGTLCKRMDCV